MLFSTESTLAPTSKAEVYVVRHDSPEVLAYGMAKYSRSALSLRDALQELSSQKSAEFLKTFYFEYGHKSIADMAHIALAIENISLLAAIAVVDEQRWDGQERSTRYQDFKNRDFYIPHVFPSGSDVLDDYVKTIHGCFDGYQAVHKKVFDYLRETNPANGMDHSKWIRTINARAFNVARYLLPLATKNSVGQIVSGRPLENQISRLRSSSLREVQLIGGWLYDAASNPDHGTPTLLKYAEKSEYRVETAKTLQEYVAGISGLRNEDWPERASYVELIKERVEDELVASILYPYTQVRYSTLLAYARSLQSRETRLIIELATDKRGQYDELLRSFQCGYDFQFEILMDIGGVATVTFILDG